MRNFLFFLLFVVFTGNVQADIPDREKYDKFFAVDINEKLPTMEELQKYYSENHSRYDRKYDWHWDIGNLFDQTFRLTINEYGGTDKRVKAENEEALMMILEQMPSEYYQYIGPLLHTIPSISEKILNMPGIKETKNKFPTRIAPQLADVEDLEFLSPVFYFLLMPEVWSGNDTQLEQPKIKKSEIAVKSERNTALYEKIKQLVPAEQYYPDAKVKKGVDLSDLRTINITINSPLTSGDIKAFLKTIPELNKLQSDVLAMGRIYGAGALLDVWENETGRGLPVNGFKDLIYPCSRLLQKMRIAGDDKYLKHIVAKEGFTPEAWAYTCDKTIKAYRMITLSNQTVIALKSYALGVYDDEMRHFMSEKMIEIQHLNMQGALRMHEVPRHDILEAYKNRILLRDSFTAAKYSIISAPIFVSD